MEENFDSSMGGYLSSISNSIQSIQVETNELQYLAYSFIPTMNYNLSQINKNLSQVENQVVTTNGLNTKILDLESQSKYHIGSIITGFKAASSILGILGSLALIVKVLGGGGMKEFWGNFKNILKPIKSLYNKVTHKDYQNDEDEEDESNKEKGVAKELEGEDGKKIEVHCECHCECHCDCQGGGSGDGKLVPETDEVLTAEPRWKQITENFGLMIASVGALATVLPALSSVFKKSLEGMFNTSKLMSPKIATGLSKPFVEGTSEAEKSLVKFNKESKLQLNGITNNINKNNKEIIDNNILLSQHILSNTTKSNKELLKNYNSYYSKLTKDTTKGLSKIPKAYKKSGETVSSTVSKNGKEITKANSATLNDYNKGTAKGLSKVDSTWKNSSNNTKGTVTNLGKVVVASVASSMLALSKSISSTLSTVESTISTKCKSIKSEVNSVSNTIKGSINGCTNDISRVIKAFSVVATGIVLALVVGIGVVIATHIPGWVSGFAGGISLIMGLLKPFGPSAVRIFKDLATKIAGVIVEKAPSWARGFSGGLDAITEIVGPWVTKIEGLFSGVGSYVGRVFGDISSAVGKVEGLISDSGVLAKIAPYAEDAGEIALDAAPLLLAAKIPSESTWDHSRLRKISGSSMFGGNADGAVNVVINSPKALNPFEVRRQLEQTSRNMANGFY